MFSFFDLLRGFAGFSIVRLLTGEVCRGPQSGQHGILPRSSYVILIIILFWLGSIEKKWVA
jgi:hypothetical protein